MQKRDPIEILQQNVEIPNIVQKKANQAFARVKKENKVMKFPKKRIGVMVAAAILSLATISAAAAYFQWSKSLSEGLHATTKQKLQMEETHMTTFVGQESVDGEITVTVVQSITDNYYTHIAFKVEGFEIKYGIQPDFEKVNVIVDGKEDFSWGSSFYNGLIQGTDGRYCNADGTPVDENAKMIEHYVMPDGSMEYQITLANTQEKGYFINKPIHVEMQNLGTVSNAAYTNQIEGNWSFDWNLQGSAEQREYDLKAPLADTGATVVKAQISPISLRVEYQFPRTFTEEIVEDENGAKSSRQFYDEPPKLTGVKMQDGTLLPFLYAGPGSSGYESEDSDIYFNSFAIDRILDVDQVESLLFIKSYPENSENLTEEYLYAVPLK